MRSVALTLFFLSLMVPAAAQSTPHTIVLDERVLERQRSAVLSSSDPEISAIIRLLIRRAEQLAADGKTFSVAVKSQTPPSGDKHDYMSQAPYWWPDPSKPNGLPYIRRDGQRNPELDKITDHKQLDKMLENSEILALAYYFTGEEKFAKHAANVLRAWFIDPRTRQNPNLNFAQGIPGIADGRGIGMIETRHMHRAIDAAILLDESRSWTRNDDMTMRKWFGEFLDWILKSPLGKDEADERNNHGTYYDVQVAAYAIYTGRPDLAKRQLETTRSRITSQIEPDGSQPHELARTLSWNYTNMNLLGFFILARIGESVGVDLWNYRTPEGRSIKAALDWLVPFASGQRTWSNQQIKPRSYDVTTSLLNLAEVKYKETKYAGIAKRLESPAADPFVRIGLY